MTPKRDPQGNEPSQTDGHFPNIEGIPVNDWHKFDALLSTLDEEIRSFAKRHGTNISKNYHDCPERSLQWNEKGVNKQIGVYLSDWKRELFNFGICASRDRWGIRYWRDLFRTRDWKGTVLLESVPFSEIRDKFPDLLRNGFETLRSWTATDLSPV